MRNKVKNCGRIWRGTGQLLDDAAADIDRDAAHLGERLVLGGGDAALRLGDLLGQGGGQRALAFRGLGGEAIGGFLDRRLGLGARFRQGFLVGGAGCLGLRFQLRRTGEIILAASPPCLDHRGDARQPQLGHQQI